MLSYRFICFVALLSALYFVIIALIYTGVQFYYFMQHFSVLQQNMNRIDTLLTLSQTKTNIAFNAYKQTRYDISKNIKRLQSIFRLLYPLLHSQNVNARLKRMDKKMNAILRKMK